ncbi:hypothetical protein LTR91_016949 [Friedmanniomyces endolithicus]|uniref:NADH dehydrogenase [ubiquinone] iron-sulfur protein 5 n=1 Tax=Friedmanniomyces endolithicus TaxID=329885 RepID=A0AAN6QK67_9PEZI|nr:hypothetical protein LTR75_012771 [Friedmanniomyces endolithicus]KAK0799483.1 hypothetical protein LTR59_006121 [Friedmanniomyces endolithicus]KAK0809569.1 hypothetical protein LTR38_004264 [Friedmanniomyces endolithicus]KAK0852658.1 hypothetical protein LTR03_003371 [Friedmanniomyces endolithicus]KAK0853079.1 hypothetical protein LTS02_012124 [Friedmanniomyces endolithicus]
MASGFGLNGGPSRCFPFWQEVLACYVVNTDADNDSGKHKCRPVLEDYYECLHHKKEAAKISALQAAYRRREAQTPRDQAPSAGEIRSLGLLDRKAEEVDISAASAIPRYSSNAPGGETMAEKVGLK